MTGNKRPEDDEPTLVIPIVSAHAESIASTPSTVATEAARGTRRDRRLATKRQRGWGTWGWLLYSVAVVALVVGASLMATR
jgi:hypothetical protein